MKRGEVRWFRFARPDKQRPVVLLTRDFMPGCMGEVAVAPVTSVIRDIPCEASLGREDGMPRGCAVNCDHAQTFRAAGSAA